MNSTQNKKIEQVKETTMIVGIDVGSEKHCFRAFNWRGIELTRVSPQLRVPQQSKTLHYCRAKLILIYVCTLKN